jgi:hypothetical protein
MTNKFAIIKPTYSIRIRNIYSLISLLIYLGLVIIIGMILIPKIIQFVSNDYLQKGFIIGYFLLFAFSYLKLHSIIIDRFEIIGWVEIQNDTITINNRNTQQILKNDFIKQIKLKGSLGLTRNNTAHKSFVVDFLTKDNNVISIEMSKDLYINGRFKHKSILWWRKDLFDVLKKNKLEYKI